MDSMTLREQLKDKKRIVVKVGSSSLTHPETGHVDLIKLEKPVSYTHLLQLMEDYIPLGMNCNLVLLDWSSHMDTHCYLDKNSRLSIPEQADTSGFVLGGNYVLG